MQRGRMSGPQGEEGGAGNQQPGWLADHREGTAPFPTLLLESPCMAWPWEELSPSQAASR